MTEKLCNKKTSFIPVFLLIVFFIVGLCIYQDYGATADEPIQIQAGHVIWRYICLKFGLPVPEAISSEPDLHGFKNSYYGQAAAFPTVILEALRGFRMDSSTVIRIRHLWNFLCFFTGLALFSFTLYKIFGSWKQSTFGILLMVLLPRIFGDIFYNDRDIMLISWMMISISAFYWVIRRSGWFPILACGFAFGMAFNTRIFGLVLLVFPALFFVFTKNRKKYVFLIIAAVFFWFLFSPIAWENPIQTIPEAFIHLATQQRSIDTLDGAQLLFFGKQINETQLPWYYIPLYILVTTPVMTSLAALIGIAALFFRAFSGKTEIRDLITLGMLIILITVQAIGIIFHLTFYDGWRHFYFLYVPIIWLSIEGITFVLGSRHPVCRIGCMILMSISFLVDLIWIIQVHPYQIIYLNPVVRSRWIGKFDRDYWDLSSKEGIEYLLDNSNEIAIHVTDNHWFSLVLLGFQPEERDRIHTYPYKAQPYPFEYLFFNYKNAIGNEKQFAYYVPVYSIERDGMKLSEVFQRSHYLEINSSDAVESILSLPDNDPADTVIDGDYDTCWIPDEKDSGLIVQFKQKTPLTGLELFPKGYLSAIPKMDLYASDDGISWTELAWEEKGTNGISFPVTRSEWIKILFDSADIAVNEIIFYGAES